MSSTETSTALESVDADERSAKLHEGKDLLLERNKHILLAEKYGWDTVACYTAEPLATDSDDEKRIRKAVKESKQLQDEKKRSSTAKVRKVVFPGNLPNVKCSSTGHPPLLLRGENSLLPVRFAPHAFAVFDKDISPGIAEQQLPLAGPIGADKQAHNSLPSDGLSNLFLRPTKRGAVDL